METAVLLLTYNRPIYTERLFEVLRKHEIRDLFVFNDGPKGDSMEDRKAREEIIRLVATCDWECNIRWYLPERNMGCGEGVSSAIDWAFNFTEELIILEDDCIPNDSFFNYCRTMLEMFKHDEIVMHISGSRWSEDYRNVQDFYFFSKYAHVWGWATWKRAWKLYDYKLRSWSEMDESNFKAKFFKDEYRYWQSIWDMLIGGSENINTWDYQWQFCIHKYGGICVTPEVNLISNIGTEGTHTTEGRDLSYYNRATFRLEFPSCIPKYQLENNNFFDRHHFNKHINKRKTLAKRINNKLRRFIRRKFKSLIGVRNLSDVNELPLQNRRSK